MDGFVIPDNTVILKPVIPAQAGIQTGSFSDGICAAPSLGSLATAWYLTGSFSASL
ncbi:hypothetical protein GQF23_11415 [Neisseria meningitidis]|nr:hypothetical protein [Neisseria meningitidis]